MTKRLLAFLLCAVMALCLLAGCGTGGAKDTEPSKSIDGTTEPAQEQITLKIGLPQSVYVTDYNDNVFTKWLEEETGYKLEFQLFQPSASDYRSQLSVMVADGSKLPDILWGFNLGDALYEQYGEDGYFIDLSEYYADKEGKAKVFWEQMSRLDEDYQKTVMRRCTSSNGAMYPFPAVESTLIDTMNYQVYINQEWLDRLGLEKPTDRDSLVTVLKAFRDQDANGNGNTKDEIPLIGSYSSTSAHIINWLINMFLYNDATRVFSVDENGKLWIPALSDEYREALIFINGLIKDNLLSPLCFSVKDPEIRQMVTPASGPAMVGIVVGHPSLAFNQEDAGIGMLNYEALPLWGNAVLDENSNRRTTFITEDCANPDAAWNLLMHMCSREGALRMRYGVPGVNWDYADEGAESIMGFPAEIKLYADHWGVNGNESWKTIQGTVLINAEYEGNQLTGNESEVLVHKFKMYREMRASYDEQIANYNPDPSRLCPLLIRNEEELEATEQIASDCRNYINKSRSEFCTGVMDPGSDADWNAYLKQLEDLHIQTWIDCMQGVYERTIAE